jgi:hypothetical protein
VISRSPRQEIPFVIRHSGFVILSLFRFRISGFVLPGSADAKRVVRPRPRKRTTWTGPTDGKSFPDPFTVVLLRMGLVIPNDTRRGATVFSFLRHPNSPNFRSFHQARGRLSWRRRRCQWIRELPDSARRNFATNAMNRRIPMPSRGLCHFRQGGGTATERICGDNRGP